MTYDPGKIIPGLICMNCGFVGLQTIVGGGATCNQCGWVKNYGGSKPGFPTLSVSGQKFIADPTKAISASSPEICPAVCVS